jgi:hypothetical protein
MKEKIYACALCGKEKTLRPGDKVPECCGRPMTLKLDKCTRPFAAETARSADDDEPCDEGTDTIE